MSISDAERHRRSEQAKRQHRQGPLGHRATARKAGKKSGEVRARRASDLAAQLVEENKQAM